MQDKTDWTKPLLLEDDLCEECGDMLACPQGENKTQSIEVEGYSVCLTCPNFTERM